MRFPGTVKTLFDVLCSAVLPLAALVAAETSRLNGQAPPPTAKDRADFIRQQAEQAKVNPSGNFTWDMGMVYPGVVYKPPFPLSNGCPYPQAASMSYPNPPIPLSGEPVYSVPPGTTIEYLTLLYPPDQESTPNAFCTMEVGILTSIHQEDRRRWGNGWYTCFEAKRTFLVSACVYHGPVDDGGGGGGGKPKKKSGSGGLPTLELLGANPCADYWTTNRFVASSKVPAPEYCLSYFRERAHQLFDQFLRTNRAADPAQWAWVPTGSAIDSLSVEQIMNIKANLLVQLLPPIK